MQPYHVSPNYSDFKWPESLITDFKNFLQMNPSEFDSDMDLQRCLMTSAGQWEEATDAATLQTSFTQSHTCDTGCHPKTIYLMKQPFVRLTSVQYVNGSGQTVTAANGTDYDLDSTGRVASIRWRGELSLHRFIRPKITIVFVAGYTGPMPADVQFAVFSLAKWHYLNRTAFTDGLPVPCPGNFRDLTHKYTHGRGWL